MQPHHPLYQVQNLALQSLRNRPSLSSLRCCNLMLTERVIFEGLYCFLPVHHRSEDIVKVKLPGKYIFQHMDSVISIQGVGKSVENI